MNLPANDLQISQDLNYQRRSWAVQRAGWALFAVILLSAAAGLFGRGFMGQAASISESGALSVEYPRFWRIQAPMVVRFRAASAEPGSDELRLWLNRAYLDRFSVSQVMPQPDRVEAGRDRLTFVFALGPSAGDTTITFEVEPKSPWRLRGRAGLGENDSVDFAHFVYP